MYSGGAEPRNQLIGLMHTPPTLNTGHTYSEISGLGWALWHNELNCYLGHMYWI